MDEVRPWKIDAWEKGLQNEVEKLNFAWWNVQKGIFAAFLISNSVLGLSLYIHKHYSTNIIAFTEIKRCALTRGGKAFMSELQTILTALTFERTGESNKEDVFKWTLFCLAILNNP